MKIILRILFILFCLEIVVGLPEYMGSFKKLTYEKKERAYDETCTVLLSGGCILGMIGETLKPIIKDYNAQHTTHIQLVNRAQARVTRYSALREITEQIKDIKPDLIVIQSTQTSFETAHPSKQLQDYFADLRHNCVSTVFESIVSFLKKRHLYRFVSALRVQKEACMAPMPLIAKDSAFLKEEKALKEAIKNNPAHWDEYQRLSALYIDILDYTNAVAVLDAAAENFQSADIYTEIGHMYRKEGFIEKAHAILVTALEKDSTSQRAAYELLELYNKAEKKEQYESLKKQYPENPLFNVQSENDPAYYLSYRYAIHIRNQLHEQEQWDALIEVSLDFLGKYPNAPTRDIFVRFLADAYLNKQNYEESLEYYTQLQPYDIWTVLNLAHIYEEMGDSKKSETFFSLARKMREHQYLFFYYSIVKIITERYNIPIVCLLGYKEDARVLKALFGNREDITIITSEHSLYKGPYIPNDMNVLDGRKPTQEGLTIIAQRVLEAIQQRLSLSI